MYSTLQIRRALALALAVVLVGTEVLVGSAHAFMADFFAKDTSGQAIYEDMAIGPQAVHMDGVTYIAYQGWLNDPYITAFDHATREWDGPYKVGDNPLNVSANPLNTHGAPALYADRTTGHLYVYWGAHGSTLRYSRTIQPRKIDAWRVSQPVATGWNNGGEHPGGVTYPQVVSYETTGGVRAVELFYRTSDNPRRGWASKRTSGPAETLRETTATPILEGSLAGLDGVGWGWYATFEADRFGRVHMAAISQPVLPGQIRPFVRHDVYYAYREPGEVEWRDITGQSIVATESPVLTRDSMLAAGSNALVYEGESTYQNQVSIAIDSNGDPALLFLSGPHDAVGPDSQEWVFARWDDDEQRWKNSTIGTTDHFMDAGALDFPSATNPDLVEAFIVTGGTTGSGTLNPMRRYDDRGGDIWRYVSYDGGESWTTKAPVRSADPARREVYNDPQIVRTDDPASNGKARLIFCQWDNEADIFINKVFLWGEVEGFAQREFLPGLHRLAGETRVETAVEVSKESFPLAIPTVPPLPNELRSRKVFVTTGMNYADALSGVPLAYAYRAPMLFVVGDTLSPAVSEEIARLRGSNPSALKLDVVILGGPVAVSPAIENALRDHPDTRNVRRIQGQDRYVVSSSIALELAGVIGVPDGVFVASGQTFPDALAAAPVAAAKGQPILLTTADSLNEHTELMMKVLRVDQTVVVGGPNTIAPSVLSEITTATASVPTRVFGHDRYATAAAVAELGLDGHERGLGVLSMDRFVVASGEQFPDALAGGLFAARLRGPVLLTQSDTLPSVTHGFLERHGYEVLDAYVLGGELAVTPTVVARVAEVLHERKHDQRLQDVAP